MLPLTVGVASALLVFSVLVFAFGDAGSSVAAPPAPPPGSTPQVSSPSSPSAPRVVKSEVSGPGDFVALVVTMELGEELRLKVVPGPGLDAQVGLTMPKDELVPDYIQKGFKGDVQRLFPIQNGVLYGDTLTPTTTVALEANDLGKEGAGEWLAFVAPTAADYTVVVRGRGVSTGSYTLTLQTRPPSGAVAAAKRLAATPAWLDLEAVQQLARDDLAFLMDPTFYADGAFRTNGGTGPTREDIESLIAGS